MTPDDGFRRDRDPLRRRNARLAAVAAALSLGVLVAIGIWLSRPHPAVTQPLAQATPTQTTTPMPSPTPLPTPTPAPVPCNAGLQLTGAYNDCAQSLSNQSQPCQVSTNSLFMVTHLHGSQHDYLLYIQVGNRTSPLPGVYVLPSPQTPPFSNTNATPTVAVREYETGAFWQAIAGTIHVGQSGASGQVFADLKYQGGLPTQPAVDLKIAGSWSCR